MSEHRIIHSHKVQLQSYSIGFILSLLLTVVPFVAVMRHAIHGSALVAILFIFAILQLMVQLLFFMHLTEEKRPRLQATALAFMVMVVIIVAGGSLWIMYNLNYHQPSSKEYIEQLQKSDDL